MVTSFEQGDIIYVNFDPQSGHEQRGRRPALVVSNLLYNRYCNLVIACPITHTDRNLPFQVRLDARTKTTGVVMCDQVRSLDAEARDAEVIERIPDDLLAEIVDIIISFIEISPLKMVNDKSANENKGKDEQA